MKSPSARSFVGQLLLMATPLLFACSKTPTQIVVAVDSDLEVPADMTRIVVDVRWGDASNSVSRTFPLRAFDASASADRVSLPFSFGVGPGAQLGGEVTINLRGENARSESIVARRVRTRFVAGRSLRLPMFLARSCRGETCAGASTCTELGCRSDLVDPTTLEETEPGTELIGIGADAGPRDASTPDQGVGDLGPRSDLGVSDAGVLDASPTDGSPSDAGRPPCAPPATDGDTCGPDGFRCCGGSCVDTNVEPTACGPSCVACPSTESCIGGECRRCTSSADCPVDDLICTNAPECNDGVCVEPLFDGWCLIDGECHGIGAINAGDACQACDPAASISAWTTTPGASCNDGLFCTAIDTCDQNGACVGTGSPCPTNLPSCLTGSCDEAGDVCKDDVQPNECFIDGTCLPAGRPHPTNVCLACLPGQEQRAWTPNQGAACNDGRYCTAVDTCNAQGQCMGSSTTPCPPAPSCAMSMCIESPPSCNVMPGPGFCLIDDSCVSAGTAQPGQPCMVCNPGMNMFGYTPRPDNTVCGGNALCCTGVCTGATQGACGACGANCPVTCLCGGQGDPFSCSCLL